MDAPEFFKCAEDGNDRTYAAWLKRRAVSLRRHDKKLGKHVHPTSYYRNALDTAVRRSGGVDEYSGEPIDWSLAFDNRNATSGARARRSFGAAPSIDHINGAGLRLAICRDDTNTAKGCMTVARFYELCDKVAVKMPRVPA